MPKGKQKITHEQQIVHQRTDYDTGEIITDVVESTRVITKAVNTKDFIQVYLEDLSGIFKLETKNEIRLISIIWRECEFNPEKNTGNKIVIVKAIKDEWAKEIGVTTSTINNTLVNLVKKQLLITENRSIYILNPLYFFKGFSKDQPKVVRTVLEYKVND